MFWKVKYYIDDGYAVHRATCVIHADSEEKAHEILHNEVGKKLSTSSKGNKIIVDKYTNITKCEDDVILYNSWKV